MKEKREKKVIIYEKRKKVTAMEKRDRQKKGYCAHTLPFLIRTLRRRLLLLFALQFVLVHPEGSTPLQRALRSEKWKGLTISSQRTRAYTQIHIHTHEHTFACMCVNACVCVCLCRHTHICTHVVCTVQNVRVCVCVCARMHNLLVYGTHHANIHTYTNIHMDAETHIQVAGHAQKHIHTHKCTCTLSCMATYAHTPPSPTPNTPPHHTHTHTPRHPHLRLLLKQLIAAVIRESLVQHLIHVLEPTDQQLRPSAEALHDPVQREEGGAGLHPARRRPQTSSL